MTLMRRTARGRFELPVTASEAIDYFTPEGERGWAPGWDPGYPAGDVAEAPGTVFVTSHGDVETIWVIEKIDRDAHTAAYARITAGRHAGTVRVECEDLPDDRCVVSVEYDMTALSSDPKALQAFDEAPFAEMMAGWEGAVTTAIAASHHSTLED